MRIYSASYLPSHQITHEPQIHKENHVQSPVIDSQQEQYVKNYITDCHTLYEQTWMKKIEGLLKVQIPMLMYEPSDIIEHSLVESQQNDDITDTALVLR